MGIGTTLSNTKDETTSGSQDSPASATVIPKDLHKSPIHTAARAITSQSDINTSTNSGSLETRSGSVSAAIGAVVAVAVLLMLVAALILLWKFKMIPLKHFQGGELDLGNQSVPSSRPQEHETNLDASERYAMVGTTARRRPSCSSGDCGGGGDHIYSAVGMPANSITNGVPHRSATSAQESFYTAIGADIPHTCGQESSNNIDETYDNTEILSKPAHAGNYDKVGMQAISINNGVPPRSALRPESFYTAIGADMPPTRGQDGSNNIDETYDNTEILSKPTHAENCGKDDIEDNTYAHLHKGHMQEPAVTDVQYQNTTLQLSTEQEQDEANSEEYSVLQRPKTEKKGNIYDTVQSDNGQELDTVSNSAVPPFTIKQVGKMEQAVTPHCERSACAGQGVASSDTYCAVDMSRDTEAVQATVASPTAIKPTLNVITSGPPTSQAAVYVNTGDYGNGRMLDAVPI
ncbi:uncharacterized protein LOC135825890 [Sycon ciliatum]|uniref:uncharacterized protein LOC135825890 n=1 Tax=Sycon ciliatum TaxID=27933 RepID=UPI0031F7073B